MSNFRLIDHDAGFLMPPSARFGIRPFWVTVEKR